MTKLPAGVLCSFHIYKVSLTKGHRSKYVRILLFKNEKSLRRYYIARNGYGFPSGILGAFLETVDPKPQYRRVRASQNVGDLCLIAGVRNMFWTAVHEAHHAAFSVAQLLKFPNDGLFPPKEYEEFVVRTGEYISQKLIAELRRRKML